MKNITYIILIVAEVLLFIIGLLLFKAGNPDWKFVFILCFIMGFKADIFEIKSKLKEE